MSKPGNAPMPKVGKPPAYNAMPFGSSAVDPIAERLAEISGADCRELSVKLRNSVVDSHAAGIARWVAYRDADVRADAFASLTAIRRLSAVLNTRDFLPTLSRGAAICNAENPMFADWLRDLVIALDRVPALETVIATGNARPPITRRSNPGRLYMRGLVSHLVADWSKLTGEPPARRPSNRQGNATSTRALFHDLLAAAIKDLGLKREPIGELVRDAVDRIERGEPPQ